LQFLGQDVRSLRGLSPGNVLYWALIVLVDNGRGISDSLCRITLPIKHALEGCRED